MLALKVNELRKTHNTQEPQAEEESPENSSRPEDVKDEPLDQTTGSELGSPSPQVADALDTLNTDSETDTPDTEKLLEEPNLDRQQISIQDLLIVHESEEYNDYFWTLDTLTAKRVEEQKRASEEKLQLLAQASKAQALEQQNIKLSEELHESQSMCDCLQQKIRDLELEMTNNSTEHNMVMILQEDLQREREKLISVNKKVSDLTHELDCKKTQLVVERREASQEILVLLTKINEAQEYKKEFQKSESLLSSNESEMLCVKEMNLNLKRQNTLLEQGNLELSAKLNQVENKLYFTETTVQKLQKKIMELELELGDNSTNHSRVVTRLEEDLQNERAQLTAVNKKLSDLMEQFHDKETELQKASRENVLLVHQVSEAQSSGQELQKTLSRLSSMESEAHQLKEMNLELKTQSILLEQENLELAKELNQVKTKQDSTEESFQHFAHECDCLHEKIRELELELADNSTNRRSIIARHQEDLRTERERLNVVKKNFSDLMQEFHHKETQLIEKLEKVSKEKVALQAQLQEAQTSAMNLQKTQSLLSSVESEVQQVKDMNLKLERQNNLLEQENLKISTELHQVKTKLSSTDESFQHLVHECEHLQEKIRELELEQADNSTNRSIITRLEEDLKTERAQLTAVNKKVSDRMQEFHHKETELREKLEKVSKEKLDLQAQVREAQTSALMLQKTQSLLSSMEAEMQQVKDTNLKLERQNKLLEQKNLKISTELHQVKTKQISTDKSFQRLLFDCERLQPKINETELEKAEKATNSSKVISFRKAPQTEWEQLIAINKTVSALMQVMHHKEIRLVEELEKAFKENLALKARVNKDKSSVQEFQKTQSLLSSMESEVQQVRGMNLELKTQNALLEQENLELFTELNEVKTKQEATEESFQHLAHECECLQEQIRNLQSERADTAANSNQKQNQQTKSTTVNTDNQAMLELLQKCLTAQLPKHEDDATIGGLEKENKDLTDMSSSLTEKNQKKTTGHGKKDEKKLQQQVPSTTANSEVVSYLPQQLNVRPTDRVTECKKTKEELINTQQANQRLTEELYCILMEYNRINKKYNEDQMKCETMLCQAEHKFNKETGRLSSTIQMLKKEVNRLTSLLAEEKERFSEYRMKLGRHRALTVKGDGKGRLKSSTGSNSWKKKRDVVIIKPNSLSDEEALQSMP